MLAALAAFCGRAKGRQQDCLPHVLLMCAIIATPAFAQRGTGELRVTVLDPVGAPVAAAVQAIDRSAQFAVTVHTTSSGTYTFKNVPFGPLTLQISAPGFAPYSETILIDTELPLSRTVVLTIAPVETALHVTEAPALLDPKRTNSAYYVGTQQIRDRLVSQPGRDLLNLVVMQPGWLLEANGVLHPRGAEYDTQYIIDGFPVQDNRSPAFAPGLDPADVQSMRVSTAGYPAEYGNKLGGVVEVNTTPNANPGFHGMAGVEGGSFDTFGGYMATEFTANRTTASVSGQGFLTDRYLDPPVLENYSNHASGSGVTATIERDLTDADRIRLSVIHHEARFLVPNELLQQQAGQRQDRNTGETTGQFSYQHVFSPHLLAVVRAMGRDLTAGLWSNPLSTPIGASQDRGFRQAYFNGSVSGHNGRHEWKAGFESSFASLYETFGYQIRAYDIDGEPIFDPDTPARFSFRGAGKDRENSAFAQDQITLGHVTVSAGLRFDRYHLLVDESALSPRVSASWYIPRAGLVLHASYDRIFGTPPIENILLSGSEAVREVSENTLYLPLRPSRANFYEGGFTKALVGHVSLAANYFRRDIRNVGDDDLLLNTGVSFPIAFQSAVIRGTEVKLQVPTWGGWSGFVSYSNMVGTARLPVAGGLFLDASAADLLASNASFPITQDQRNTARANVHYTITPRIWTSWTASYGSGLPVELEEDQDLSFLESQYGAAILNRVNFARGRLRPSFQLDASFGAEMWRYEKRTLNLEASVLNLTNRVNVIDFAGVFSGTAVGMPRSFGLRLRFAF